MPAEPASYGYLSFRGAGAAHHNGGDGRQKGGPSGPPSGRPSGTVAPRGQGCCRFRSKPERFRPVHPAKWSKTASQEGLGTKTGMRLWTCHFKYLDCAGMGSCVDLEPRAGRPGVQIKKKEKRNSSSIILRLSLLRVVVTVRSGC